MGNAIKISVHLDYETDAKHSVSSEGTIVAAQAGQPLTGTVVLQLKKRARLDIVKLFVTGEEVVVSQNNGRTRRDERSLLHVVNHLADMRNQWVERGTYPFEFAVNLSELLPSSMKWGDPKRGCCVRYRIAASVGMHSTEKDFSVISAPLQNIKIPCFIEPKTETIKSMGLLNAGCVTFGACVDNTQVGRGQEIDVSLACLNNTTVAIRSVEVKVVEMIRCWPSTKAICQKIPLLEVKNVDMPGLVKSKRSRRTIKENQQKPDYTHAFACDLIYQALTSGENILTVVIPMSARNTYAGRLVKVQHYMKVKLITSTFAENLSIKIPIHVGNAMMHDPLPEQRFESPMPTPGTTFPDIHMIAARPIADPTVQQDSKEFLSDNANTTMLGEAAVNSDEDTDPDCDVTEIVSEILDTPIDLTELTPVAAPSQSVPSLNRLLQRMTTTANGYSEITQRLAQDDWNHVFQNLQPGDFGRIIASVRNDFDQPRVAAIVAGRIERFTCAHCVLALRNTSNWNRTTVIGKLVSLCTDLESQNQTIIAELSQWEQVVTAKDCANATNARMGNEMSDKA